MKKENEKTYTVLTDFYEASDRVAAMHWYDQFGNRNAPGNLPSELFFSKDGYLTKALWHKDDKTHSIDDRPSHIAYDENSHELYLVSWHFEGYGHREGDKPSCLQFDHLANTWAAVEYAKHGKYVRENGKVASITFDDDGIAYDEETLEVIEFNEDEIEWPSSVAKTAPLYFP